MAPFPYMPMLAIMASLISQQVVQMSVFAYAPFMVEQLGVVDDRDKAGELLACFMCWCVYIRGGYLFFIGSERDNSAV